MRRDQGPADRSDAIKRSLCAVACGILAVAGLLEASQPVRAEELPETRLPGRELAPGPALGDVDLDLDLTARDARNWQMDREARPRFYRAHLLPRVERQFGKLGHYRWAAEMRPGPTDDHLLQEEVTQAARKGLERATQKAIEDYLMEETALRFLVVSLDRRSRKADAGEGRRRDAVRLGVGISHGLPELELRTRIAGTPVKFELNAEGELGVGYRSPRSGRADIFARFDPSNQRYSLNTRFSY